MSQRRQLRMMSLRNVIIFSVGIIAFVILYLARDEFHGPVSVPLPLRGDVEHGEYQETLPSIQSRTSIVSNSQTAESDDYDSPGQDSKTAEPENRSLTIQQRFRQRWGLLQAGCQHYRKSRGNSKTVYRGDFFYIPKEVFYCGIEKVGSTEWKDLFKDMAQHNFPSRILTNWSEVLRGQTNPYKSARTKFFFVREPYGRMLSAYVDKLFSPNVMFWNYIGKHIVKNFRPNPTSLSLHCGHDVTFAEFIDYIIDAERTGRKADGHFTPQFTHCYVCEFPYSYVGHMETLKDDRDFLLDDMKSPVEERADYVFHNLEAQVSWYIRDYYKYKHCMTLDQALRRLWQKLKIRGHLHSSVDFPFTPQQSRIISIEVFTKVASTMVEASQNISSSLKQNKRQALKEAFDTVPLSKKKELVQLFGWDFELFGYERHPKEVFGTVDQHEDKYKKANLLSLNH